MLTRTQREYFHNLSNKKLSQKVVVEAWNPKSLKIANTLTSEIEERTGETVLHAGSSALQIAGEKDIDLFIFKKEIDPELIPKISDLLKCNPENLKWKFTRDGFKVTLKLANPVDQKRKEYALFFKVLKSNPFLRKKYESVKIANSRSFQKYIVAKMDFVTRVVNVFSEDNQQRMEFLIENGCAVNNSHVFVNKSLHSSQSFDTRIFIKNKALVQKIVKKLMQSLSEDFDIVVGIPRNGDILGQQIAKMRNKVFVSIRNISSDVLKNKRVLVVDDTVVTGKTIMGIVDTIRGIRGIVVGAVAICCRQNIPDILFQNDSIKFAAYLVQDDTLFGYPEETCPYCRAGVSFSSIFGFYE